MHPVWQRIHCVQDILRQECGICCPRESHTAKHKLFTREMLDISLQ